MRPFVEYCNEQRQNAETVFESDCTNCCRTVFFVKTCEYLRKHANARFVSDPKKFITAADKATFKRCTIINSDLVLVESTRARIMMNRLFAVGFTILELSKLVMYSAYYDQLLPRYADDLRLCFSDTDSFIFWVKTPDLHADMADMRSGHLQLSTWSSTLLRQKQKKTGIFQIRNRSLFSVSVLWTQVENVLSLDANFR